MKKLVCMQKLILALVAPLALGVTQSWTIHGQEPPTPTERLASELNIDLSIVGDSHPALPDLKKGYKTHGGFDLRFKDGRIDYARVMHGRELLQPVVVFYRESRGKEPSDVQAVGCPANPYLNLDDPAGCFRAILEKMEGGRGPVLLQVRYFSMGSSVATLPISTAALPWMYIKHYAKMENAERPGAR